MNTKTELFTHDELDILRRAYLGDEADFEIFMQWASEVRADEQHPMLDLLLNGSASATVTKVQSKQRNKFPPHYKIGVHVLFVNHMTHPERWQSVP